MRELAYREALREALREEMQRDSRVFIMGEEVSLYGGAYAVTRGLLDEFGPERVRDTPISEEAIVGAGVGAVTEELLIHNGTMRVAPTVWLTVSADHRALDGVDVARFLDTLAKSLEAPDELFA